MVGRGWRGMEKIAHSTFSALHDNFCMTLGDVGMGGSFKPPQYIRSITFNR